jgi:hypothetical protein
MFSGRDRLLPEERGMIDTVQMAVLNGGMDETEIELRRQSLGTVGAIPTDILQSRCICRYTKLLLQDNASGNIQGRSEVRAKRCLNDPADADVVRLGID